MKNIYKNKYALGTKNLKKEDKDKTSKKAIKEEPSIEYERTVKYTDYPSYLKAWEAQQDSALAHNLTKHDAKYDEYNDVKIMFGKDLEDNTEKIFKKNSKPFKSESNPDSKVKVYESKRKPNIEDEIRKKQLNTFLKNTKLKPEKYKNVQVEN